MYRYDTFNVQIQYTLYVTKATRASYTQLNEPPSEIYNPTPSTKTLYSSEHNWQHLPGALEAFVAPIVLLSDLSLIP